MSRQTKETSKEAKQTKRPFIKSDFEAVLKAATKPLERETSRTKEEAPHAKGERPNCHDISD